MSLPALAASQHIFKYFLMIITASDRLKITEEYYFSVKLQEVKKLASEGKDIINMAIGNPDLPPAQAVLEELHSSSQRIENNGYQHYRSTAELRNAIADFYHSCYQVPLNPETEVLPLIGSKEGITHISLTYLNAGDKVLVPELGYPAYAAVTKMIGAQALTFPMLEHNWHPDFERLEQMDLSGVKLMWINYPNMPTGAQATTALFDKLVAFAHKHQILLCHDNPYSLILNRDKPISLLSVDGAREIALELNSMSKSFNMPGWRIGWVAGHKNYLDQIIKIKSNVDTGMYKPLQLAAARALQLPQEWHDQRNAIYTSRKEVVHQFLDRLGCTYDPHQVGMFVWAQLPAHISSSADLVDTLLYEHDIFVAPGFVFGQRGERYIRASLCMPEERIAQALQRIHGIDL